MTRTPSERSDLTGATAPPNAIWLDTLNLTHVRQSWGDAQGAKTCIHNPLTLCGVVYARGIGTHARSSMMVDLKGAAVRFEAMAGIDDEAKRTVPVIFEVWVDGELRAASGPLWRGDPPSYFSVDLRGAQRLFLKVNDGGEWISYAHAEWAGALLHLLPGAEALPETLPLPPEEHRPIPPMDDQMARVDNRRTGVHGPRVVGATPGKPFLFRIPATGLEPFSFSADNLPDGLVLDAETGTITGCIATQGATEVLVTVTTASGTDSRKLTIIGGRRKLALTPPMGWNSWNVWGLAADDRKVRDAADHLVKSGLAAHGFQYVNIDDGWEGERDGEGNIQPNAKFPDMKALADYVHSKGLKLGIYSSPGPRTCGGFAGSYRHEQQDADTYACWGMDFLKYDWCSYGKLAPNPSVEDRKRPYRIMADALERSSRDIVYSICQYGAGNVSQWGAEVGGNLWRTTEDIGDYWGLVYEFINKQEGLEQYAGLGHWNDPDMLVVGSLGWGPSLHPTELTPFQQISHITMWCILAAPLLIGCDLSSLDEFTVNLLSNDEVLDVDQDPLGVQGRRVKRADDHEVWTRPLFDGTLAVAVLNLLKEENAVQLNLREIGVDESVPVRDLWLCRNMGEFRGKCNLVIPPQSSKLLKIGTPANRA